MIMSTVALHPSAHFDGSFPFDDVVHMYHM